jgi:hypothetical protein
MVPHKVTAATAIVALGAVILASCSPAVPSPSQTTDSTTPEASPLASLEPTPGLEATVSVVRGCENPPQVQPIVTITAEGEVVLALGDWSTRGLSALGVGQVRREVVDEPLLQVGGDYPLERLPNPSGVVGIPVHGLCTYTFTVGNGPGALIVSSASWNGDAEEAQFYVASPERKELDRLANRLIDLGSWLPPDAWADPAWSPYESASYLLWVDPQAGAAPDGIPSSAGMTWPFGGEIETFGDAVGQDRCGYLDPPQATEMVDLLSGAGVDAGLGAPVAVTGLSTNAGWVRILLTPRAPDGFPSCTDEAPFQQ